MEKEIGKMQEKINCESTSVWVYDEDESVIYPFFCTGPKSQELKQVVLKPGEGVCGYVIEHNEAVIVNNVKEDSRWKAAVDEITGYKTRNIICLPIEIDGFVYGCVEFLNKYDGDFNQKDIDDCKEIVQFMANHI